MLSAQPGGAWATPPGEFQFCPRIFLKLTTAPRRPHSEARAGILLVLHGHRPRPAQPTVCSAPRRPRSRPWAGTGAGSEVRGQDWQSPQGSSGALVSHPREAEKHPQAPRAPQGAEPPAASALPWPCQPVGDPHSLPNAATRCARGRPSMTSAAPAAERQQRAGPLLRAVRLLPCTDPRENHNGPPGRPGRQAQLDGRQGVPLLPDRSSRLRAAAAGCVSEPHRSPAPRRTLAPGPPREAGPAGTPARAAHRPAASRLRLPASRVSARACDRLAQSPPAFQADSPTLRLLSPRFSRRLQPPARGLLCQLPSGLRGSQPEHPRAVTTVLVGWGEEKWGCKRLFRPVSPSFIWQL